MIWTDTTLGAQIELISGPAFKSAHFTENSDDIPLIKGENIAQGYIAWDKSRFWPKEELKAFERFMLSPGDVVLAMDRPWIPAGLKWAEIKDHDPTCLLVQRVARLRSNGGIDQRYLKCLVGSKPFSDYIKNLMSGVNVPHISGGQIKGFRFRLPDLPTQQRIAGILSAYDDLIENNRRRIGLLEQAARLLYREWFVHLRFPGHESAKIVDGLPEGWVRCVVEDLLVLQRGFDLPVGDRKEGDVPVYGSTGIVGFHNEPKVPAPAIITGRSGSLGQVVISDTPCWPLNTALWVKELKGIPATLGYYLLVGMELEKYNGGASVPTLDRKVVHRLPAVRPSSTVADQFDSIASKSFQTIAKLRTYNAQLTRARDLLLPRLMDGRIPV